MKHTPGEWIVQHELDDDNSFIMTRDGSADIAEVCPFENGVGLANARLIASAPDLLAEHQKWARYFGPALVDVLQGNYERITELAKSLPIAYVDGEPQLDSPAIAKAEGR